MEEFIKYVWSFYGTRKVLSIPGLTIEHVIDAVQELAKRDKNFDGSVDSIDRERVKWILLDKLKLPSNIKLGSDFDEIAMYEDDLLEIPIKKKG